jgi:hypothetical protein
MDHPVGAVSNRGDRVDFDRRVRLEFWGAQISSDGGLLVGSACRIEERGLPSSQEAGSRPDPSASESFPYQ